MKHIKNKIIVAIISIVSSSLLLVGLVSALMIYNSTISTLEVTMTELAKVASERVSWELTAYKNIALEAGSVARLSSPDVDIATKKGIIDQRAKSYNFQRGNIIGLDGKSIFDGTDFSERDYVKAALKGEAYISDPVISKVTGKLSIIVAAPLWEGGIVGTRVVGVVYFAPNEDFLNQIMLSIKISEGSSAYIINKDGYTIADVNMDSVVAGKNIGTMSQTDPQYEDIAAMHANMSAGQSGFGRYVLEDKSKFLGYAPISGSNGWSLAVNSYTSEFMQATTRSILITAILLVASLIAAFVVATLVGKGIAKPITACTDRLALLSNGDLTTPVPKVKTSDETQTLAHATDIIVNGLFGIIEDLDHVFTSITQGDLSVSTSVAYPGDFEHLEIAIKEVIAQLNGTMSQINIAAEEVSSGSEQVSSGAQALSQGATEQASSIEELSSTIAEISEQIKNNAQNVKDANILIDITANEVTTCDTKMKEMIAATKDISDKSKEISKIIKTIDDIAFQTNILALNAAVEAARAGNAGKGFAVVADEVRNLAQKSAEAAKNTTELIEGSINAVANGEKIALDTASSLAKIVTNAIKIGTTIAQIAVASKEQADGAAQITTGADQIASVIQTNSATAEESAAASEELSSQSALLKSLVAKFKVTTGDNATLPAHIAPQADYPIEPLKQSTKSSPSTAKHSAGNDKY